MDISEEAPAAFRTTATRPGPLGLLGEAIGDIRSRWRLIRYLARADLKRTGADTLFGNVWWVLDPLLQMAVYVVLVSRSSSSGRRPTTRSSSSPRSCPGSGSARRLRRDHLGQRAGTADQADPVPQDRPAGRGDDRRGRAVRVRAHPAGGDADPLLSGPDSASRSSDPGHRGRPVRVHARLGLGLAALNVFFRDIGNLARHVLRLWFYLSPALYGADTIDQARASHPTIAHGHAAEPVLRDPRVATAT